MVVTPGTSHTSRILRVCGHSCNVCFQRGPILGGRCQFKFVFDALLLERVLPARAFGAEIGTAPGFFAGGIHDDMTVRGAHYPKQFALGLCLFTGDAST